MSTSLTWRWIRSGPGGPAFNMALDEALLVENPRQPTLRTYRWAPFSLSLGYFQVVEREVVERFREPGWGIVRRPTGGRAIFHGDELTYSVVWPPGDFGLPMDAVGAYELVHGALASALARFGVEAALRGDRKLSSDSDRGEDEVLCFYRSSAFDLVLDDRKLVGSAQRRRSDGFLQHGSVPCGPNPVSPLAAHAGVPAAKVEEAFAEELADAVGSPLLPGAPTPAELRRAEELADRKYSREEFTWHRARARRRPG